MKKFIAVSLVVLAAAIQAHADGFVCQTVEQDLTVRVYNQTQPTMGTRNAAIMIVSDNDIREGNRTIATFTDAATTLTNSGPAYIGNVDLRRVGTSKKGRNISGTKLGELNKIGLVVDFSYTAPIALDQLTRGELHLLKRNGEEIVRDLECQRYLKQ